MYLKYIFDLQLNAKAMTTFTHIQMSNESNAMIYVVPTSEVCAFLDELISKGVDISKSFLVKIA